MLVSQFSIQGLSGIINDMVSQPQTLCLERGRRRGKGEQGRGNWEIGGEGVEMFKGAIELFTSIF